MIRLEHFTIREEEDRYAIYYNEQQLKCFIVIRHYNKTIYFNGFASVLVKLTKAEIGEIFDMFERYIRIDCMDYDIAPDIDIIGNDVYHKWKKGESWIIIHNTGR